MLAGFESILKRYPAVFALATAAAGSVFGGVAGWVGSELHDRNHVVREQAVKLQLDSYERRRAAIDTVRTALAFLERDVRRLDDTLQALSFAPWLGYGPKDWDSKTLLPLLAKVDSSQATVGTAFAKYERALDPTSRQTLYLRWGWLRSVATNLRFDNVSGHYDRKWRAEELSLLDSMDVRPPDSVLLQVP